MSLLTDGGTLYSGGYGKPDWVRVAIERDALQPDIVEFVLLTPSWLKSRKEIIIYESPAVGPGAWTIATANNIHDDRNGLYSYQLSDGFLQFRKADSLGFMETIDEWRTIVSDAPPGSRVKFIWINDGTYAVHNPAVFVDHGRLDGYVMDGMVNITVEMNVLPPDQVEFVLVNQEASWKRKNIKRREITIFESPSSGQGAWILWTSKNRSEDRNGLYAYQLMGASLKFGNDSVIDISNATLGSRYRLVWQSI